MPTLSDIPGHFLNPSEKERFLDWVAYTHSQPWVRRDLLRLWRQLNHEQLTVEDYKKAGL